MIRSTAYVLRKTVNRIALKLPRIAGVGAVLLALLTISSCTRGTQGIFATIEVEEKTKTSNLVDNTSASALVRADLGNDELFVVRAGSKLFTRSVSGSDWSALSAPSGYLPVFLAGIDTDSPADGVVEEVYAVFFDSDRDRDQVYQLEEDGGGSLTWQPVADTVWDPAGGERITGFEGAGDRLLLSSSDGQLYSIGSGPGTPVDLGSFSVDDDRGIRAVATDAGGNTVIVGDTVHVTNDLTALGSLTDAATEIEHGRGVTVFPSSLSTGDALDTFLLVTLDGRVFTSDDGNSWNDAESDSNIPSDRSFAGVAWVDHRARLAVGTISYAGTDPDVDTSARGYYEVTGSSGGSGYSFSFTNDDISDNYRGSELSASGIARFVYYADNSTLFALTHGRGLWRTNYESDDVGGPEWFWE